MNEFSDNGNFDFEEKRLMKEHGLASGIHRNGLATSTR